MQRAHVPDRPIFFDSDSPTVQYLAIGQMQIQLEPDLSCIEPHRESGSMYLKKVERFHD